MKPQDFTDRLNKGEFDAILKRLYGSTDAVIEKQKKRYTQAVNSFVKLYPNREDIYVYSAPGRTEIGGNHTDHQHGCVLAAAVNLDVISVTAFHNEGVIRLKSEGYPQDTVQLSDLSAQSEEKGKSSSIIRGIASRFAKLV